MVVEPGLAVLGGILQVLVGGNNWNLHDLTTGLLHVMVSAPGSGAAVISLILKVRPGAEGGGRGAVL